MEKVDLHPRDRLVYMSDLGELQCLLEVEIMYRNFLKKLKI
jgi:hypothetical protein